MMVAAQYQQAGVIELLRDKYQQKMPDSVYVQVASSTALYYFYHLILFIKYDAWLLGFQGWLSDKT